MRDRHVSPWSCYVHKRRHVRVTINRHIRSHLFRLNHRNGRGVRNRMALWH